jgi:hypothetical protein
MRDPQQGNKLPAHAKTLLNNYYNMQEEARDALLLLSKGFAENMPAEPPKVLRLAPKFLRPFVLRLLLLR